MALVTPLGPYRLRFEDSAQNAAAEMLLDVTQRI